MAHHPKTTPTKKDRTQYVLTAVHLAAFSLTITMRGYAKGPEEPNIYNDGVVRERRYKPRCKDHKSAERRWFQCD